jgi:16S rRNA (adenine1518-N6/adenine1519-N6)-dimethyltransferase
MLARKRFGQHFLHDPAVLDHIVEAIGPSAGDRLVEIGPGRGALTRLLIASPHASLDAVEIDRDLASSLSESLRDEQGFTLHEADALKFDFGALANARGGRLRVVGNLPYNVSTPLLFHLLSAAGSIEDMYFMLQREVVQRIVAGPGDDAYGRLTVMLAPWVEAELIFEVGPGAFKPVPKVWSAIVRLTVRREAAFPVSAHFGAVVSAAFSHRRKTLRNALRDVVTREQIETCGIDSGIRPEMLAPHEFNALAKTLEAPLR